jgi:hypothetical protein
MSAYDNDPRVTSYEGLFGTSYIVECGTDSNSRPAVVERNFHGNGFWAFWQYGPEGRLAETSTADEAIRSLIGDPQ